MEKMTVTLTKDQRAFVEEQIAEGGHRSASAYLKALLAAERRRKAEEKLVAMVREAEESGPATPMTREDWENLRRKAMTRLAEEKAKRGNGRKKARSR